MSGTPTDQAPPLSDQELDPDFEELRPEWPRRRKILVVLLGLAAVLLLLVGGLVVWAQRQLNPSGSVGAEVLVDIPSGSTTAAIADILDDNDIVSPSWLFRYYLSFRGKGPFQAGQYRLHQRSDADDVISALEAGPLPPPSRRFTVPPGVNLRQIPGQVTDDIQTFRAEVLGQMIVGSIVRSKYQPEGAGLEGFLFPDTYEIGEGADESAVLQAMIAQFDAVADEIALASATDLVGYDPYQVLIVASLIEEEAKVDVDRAKIARVVYNRLERGEPLGIDATLCYLRDEIPCELRASDLQQDSPYNTRRVVGLPPTPIANVGRASLEAALHPEEGPWIYYVLDPELPAGQHFFTDSAAEFERAKDRCEAAGLGCG